LEAAVNTRTTPLLALLAVVSLAAPVAAAPRVSLITFSSGEDLPGAFGHTMLRVDRDGDLGTTSDQRLYDFGVWSMTFDPVSQGPDQLAALFSGLLNGEQPARKRVQEGQAVQSPSPLLYADSWEQELSLSPAALEDLARRLEQEFDFEDPDGDGVGDVYTYRHFTGNCATEFRDRIGLVLGSDWRTRLEREAAPEGTRRSLVLQDLGRAMLLNGGTLRTLPAADWQQHGAFLQMAGGEERVGDPAQMFAMLDRMVEAILGFLGGEQGATARTRIREAWSRFQDTMDQRPLSRWDAAYTPERLRRLLEDEGLLRPAVLDATPGLPSPRG
jgi:Domain of unknown function (DUF4105)